MAASPRRKIWFPPEQERQIQEYADLKRIPFTQAVRELADVGLAVAMLFGALDAAVSDHMAMRQLLGLDEEPKSREPDAPIPMESGPIRGRSDLGHDGGWFLNRD